MATDEERREVARRLRELDYGDLQESLICAYLDALGIEGYADWVGIAHRLADLIEPSDSAQTVAEDMFGQMRHSTEQEGIAYADMMARNSVELHPVDRDALLALADEMEQETGSVCGVCMGRSARRIREALGVPGERPKLQGSVQ